MAGRPANSTQPVNAHLKMSAAARARMRTAEKAVYRYYTDMGKHKGNCTWGAGILAHRGVCTPEELATRVSASMIDHEFDRRVAEAEGAVRRNISVPLNQAQFDALCSLTYNAGAKGARDTYRFVNQGDFAGAAANISAMIRVASLKVAKRKW